MDVPVRAVDQYGQVIDVWLTTRRDLTAARTFFHRALATEVVPVEVTTDRAPAYLIMAAAESEPLAFTQRLLPFVLDVIRLTDYESHEGSPPANRHFSNRSPVDEYGDSKVDDALFHGMQHALEAVAAAGPHAIRPELEVLAHDEHDSAQFLLYRALMGVE